MGMDITMLIFNIFLFTFFEFLFGDTVLSFFLSYVLFEYIKDNR